MRLLVVNGNTTQAITELALEEALRAAFVSNPAHVVVAAHAILDALASSDRGADGTIFGISLEPEFPSRFSIRGRTGVRHDGRLPRACGAVRSIPIVQGGVT